MKKWLPYPLKEEEVWIFSWWSTLSLTMLHSNLTNTPGALGRWHHFHFCALLLSPQAPKLRIQSTRWDWSREGVWLSQGCISRGAGGRKYKQEWPPRPSPVEKAELRSLCNIPAASRTHWDHFKTRNLSKSSQWALDTTIVVDFALMNSSCYKSFPSLVLVPGRRGKLPGKWGVLDAHPFDLDWGRWCHIHHQGHQIFILSAYFVPALDRAL